MTGGASVDGYLAFLLARDGEPDFARHTLARREAFFEGLARSPVRSRIPIDRAAYLRNVARHRPEAHLDERTLWLVVTAKANQAERFGVGLAELYGRITADSDPVRVHIQLQEFYHTRLLADVVGMFGLPVHPRPPALFTRIIIRLTIALPEEWHLPLAGAAEMVGCVMFRALRDRGVALFAEEPAVAGRIRVLYDEILGDEIGHVGQIASRLGPTGRSVMRGLYRLLAHRVAGGLPELRALFGRRELAARFGAAFRLDEMVAELPGRAYAAARI
jgi:hypothetical protein